MITFKQFLEADGMDPGPEQFGASAQPKQTTGKQLNGSLTDNEKRVLALLSTNQLKSSPGRARDVISGDRNMVQAVKRLKLNFKAVDVTPDGVTINQTGINLATNQGVVDANSGELTELGTKLATTTSAGTPNPKTKDLASPQGGGAPAGF